MSNRPPTRHAVLAVTAATFVAACASPPAGTGDSAKLRRIQNLVVIYAENHSSTSYDTTSIPKFITERFGLEPLPGVRANVGNLGAALR